MLGQRAKSEIEELLKKVVTTWWRGSREAGPAHFFYVVSLGTDKEATLLAAMRSLRDRSLELRRELKDSKFGDRARLETELYELRDQWRALAERRDEAFWQKMIMPGHIRPTIPLHVRH